MRPPGLALLTFPARRPVVTLAAVGVLTAALALVGVARLRPDTSIEAMFARSDPAADAMVRVLHHFAAAEELLVLVETPKPQPDPTRLLEFAKRFEQALTTSPEAASLVDAVYYRADEDSRRFVEQAIGPAGIFYLDDAAFARARQRLTAQGMRDQLRRNEALLAQPGAAAAAAAKMIRKDPLRLHEFLQSRLSTFAGDDALLSPDGQALLIRVIGKHSPSDLEFCKALVAAAERALNSANTDGLDVSVGGSYAIATTSERALRADSASSVTGAFAGLVALFAVVYRRPLRLLLLAVGPLALGSVLGFGAYAIAERSMTILSAAVGAMMVGMGIDYSVHYLTHYERRRGAGDGPVAAASETSTSLLAALFAAWITSVMGFVVVGISDIPALGTFALLGSLGLAGVFFTSLTVVPALLVLTDRSGRIDPQHGNRARLRFSVDPLLGWIARHARPCIAISLVVFAVALGVGLLLPGPIMPLEPDLTVMHPRPNPALETQEKIARRFGSAPGSMLVHLRADSPEQLVTLAHDVDRRLSGTGPRSAGIAGTLGLATLLPDPAAVQRRLAEVRPAEAERVVADFRAALAQSSFDPAQYEGYARFLRTLLSQGDPPTLLDLLNYQRLAQSFLPSAALQQAAAPTEAITLVSLNAPIDQRARRTRAVEAARTALADLPGATVAGMSVLGHDAERRVERAVPRLFGMSLALVLVYVLVHFRSLRDGLLSLTTAAFGLVVLLAVMRLAGIRLNMINLIGLPLLIGMTVDYGIFLVSLARLGRDAGTVREHVASSAQAVLVCAGATLLGFGSLAFTSVPAVRSLGVVVVIGMAAALVGALFLLTPILLANQKGQADRPAL
jgi:predicted RND superfamily exporter protein